jgi:hypothetical protein
MIQKGTPPHPAPLIEDEAEGSTAKGKATTPAAPHYDPEAVRIYEDRLERWEDANDRACGFIKL